MNGEPTPKAGVRPRQRRHRTLGARPAVAAWAMLAVWAGAAGAAQCVRPGGCSGDLPAGACGTSTQPIEEGEPCNQLNNCQKPEIVSGPTFTVEPKAPLAENQPPTFSVRISFEVKAPWNSRARNTTPPDSNIAATWKGAESSAAGVEVYRYRYTDPANPTASAITDPLGNQSTFNFERDPDSNKALLTHSTGSCASCGSAPTPSSSARIRTTRCG